MRSDLLGVALILAAWGCVTPDTQQTKLSGPWKPSRELVKSKTILPKSFKKTLVFPKNHRLLLREELLTEAKVSRPKAEVRSGPGTHFQLVDNMINRDTSVYLFERVGVWQKILAPISQTVGWVHHKVLKPHVTSGNKVGIDLTHLPTVFAMETIKTAYGYPDRNALKVLIPKGRLFKSLKKTSFGTLVWLGRTNSVMWLKGESVQ